MKPQASRTERAHFLGAWLRNPAQTGALLPSGRALARAMAAQVNLDQPGPVVELGAGTGAITQALLARGLAPQRLVLIERDPTLCRLLRLRFPRLTVLHGDAAGLAEILDAAGLARPGTLVSGLPLLSMGRGRRQLVLARIVACLDSGGKLVQFTYSPLPPISSALAHSLGVQGTRTALVAMNLPPAAVWTYTRQPDALPC